MKCKSCGSELIAGTKKCPYCGAVINIVRKRAEEVFDWSTVSPQSKRKRMFQSTGTQERSLTSHPVRSTTRTTTGGQSLKMLRIFLNLTAKMKNISRFLIVRSIR